MIAITLGSNGFHLIEIAEIQGELKTTHHLYESVQAESYIDQGQKFSEAGADKIIQSLIGFSAYLQDNPTRYCAVIATGSFRRAKNTEMLTEKIKGLLGVTVQVISAEQEGLLCYLGIASSRGFADHNRLVIDVGGGSTELMIAKKNSLTTFCSLDIGCVSLSRLAFSGEVVMDQGFEKAIAITSAYIEPYKDQFIAQGWDEVLGCGGTVSGLFSVLQNKRMCARSITLASLGRFRDGVTDSSSAIDFCDQIVPEQRALTLCAGMSIIQSVLTIFQTDRLLPCFTSVGQGLLVQLIQQQNRDLGI